MAGKFDIKTVRFTVRIRRDMGKEVKPEAEQIDGNTYDFTYGCEMTKDDPYPGEVAWIPFDRKYPPSAPQWIAAGDLVEEV